MSSLNCCQTTTTKNYKGGIPTIRLREEKKFGLNQTVQGNDSKKAFRNQNLMVNIVIRNPKPSDLKMDTSDDEINEDSDQ